MRYIVTGGAGFIGSNLCKELIKQGHNIGVIDNFSTGISKNLPKEALHLGYNIVEVLDKLTLEVDGIFHLGMPSSTPLYIDDPLLTGKVCTEMVSILEFCRRKKAKLVIASTSNLYRGNPIPWEEHQEVPTTSHYTEARFFVERLSCLYFNLYKFSSTCIRFFSVYGPGEESKGKLANIITQMVWAKRKGEAFQIYGDGKQTRDSIFVTDIIEVLLKAMDLNPGIILNAGTGHSLSFNEIASLVGCKVEYRPNPLTNYVDRQLADTRLANDILGFKAKVSIEEGIRILLE